MLQPLDGVRDRVSRAQEHLEAIQSQLLAYYHADECVVRGKYNPKLDGGTGHVEDVTITTPPIHPRLNTLVGEFLHDLRSSLDHLAWQLVLDAGRTPSRATCFPIADADPGTDKKGERRSPGVPGGVSAAARTLIGAAQPYQWGARYREHPLWLLHQLWNIDKHRYVIAQGSRTAIHQMPMLMPPFTFTTALESATEHGARLRIVPGDASVDVDMYTTIQIAIHEPDYGIERPLLRTLEEAHEAVDTLIDAVEATCFGGPTRSQHAALSERDHPAPS